VVFVFCRNKACEVSWQLEDKIWLRFKYEFIKIRTFQKVPALLSVGGLAMATLLALAQRVKTHSDNFAGL
jgi:hypothetical protein